jgi:general secretion pathway protein E
MNARTCTAAAPLDVDGLLQLLHEAGLVAPADLAKVRQLATHRRRILQRERDRRSEGQARVHPVEAVAALKLVTANDELLTEERIQRAVAAAHGMHYVHIDPLEIDNKLVTAMISHGYARRNGALPVRFERGTLVVAVTDPYTRDLEQMIATRAKAKVACVLGAPGDIQRVIEQVFRFQASVAGAAKDLRQGGPDLGNLEQLVQLGQGQTNIDGDDRHVVHAVDFLLRYALDQSASDVHIEPKRDESHVRLRIDGVLHTVQKLPRLVHHAVVSRIKTLARLDIAEKRRPQDGRIKIAHRELEVELRISTMPTAFGEKAVMRIFDPQMLLQEIDDLGFFAGELERFRSFIARPNGMVLVTGPTGSGKTTTLYSALSAVASPTINVATLEDPIEMVLERFNQTAVNRKLGLDFATMLRTLLRQDPDVIMLGEIRDAETARMGIQAAMTGHLVLSTLHTNDAPSTIGRLLDLQVEPYLLGSTLVGVIAQRLLRKVCMSCRQETQLSEDQCRALGIELRPGEVFPVYEGQGCTVCRNTGMKGRVGVFEVMPMTEKIRRLILDGADVGEIGRQASRDGMLSLREAAIKKMALGITNFDEVLRVTVEAGG